MKNFKSYAAVITVFALLFASCSKEENMNEGSKDDMATLSFGTVLNDLVSNKSALKQALDEFPACSDDAPATVEVILSQDGVEVVNTEVNVHPDPDGGIYFTQESTELELPQGVYYLTHFVVNNENGEPIWVAPQEDSDLGNFVSDALPMMIDLGAGTKTYVDVEVLCFDQRNVNQYGYLFFDIIGTEVMQYCFFANYCAPNGRHYPGRISVDVWLVNEDGGRTYIHEDEINPAGYYNDEIYAEPACLQLPDLAQYGDDDEYIFYEVTLISWPRAYGSVGRDFHTESGVLSRNEIMANYDGEDNVDYDHIRFGCDAPDDGNGEEPIAGCVDENADIFVFDQTVDVSEFPVGVNPFFELEVDGTDVGTITFILDTDDDTLIASVDMHEGISVNAWELELPEVATESICQDDITENDFEVLYDRDDVELNYPLEVTFRANYTVSAAN